MNLRKVFELLYKAYGSQGWWPAKSAYEMMVGAILTQNTNWSNVEKALANFGGAPEPQRVLSMPLTELAEIIKPSGYYNQKAERLVSLTKWFEGYGFDIENVKKADTFKLRSELLNIKGVGRETADSILLYAVGKPIFVVDAYTRRLLERLGLSAGGDYDEIRLFFEENLGSDAALYNEFHALIVIHAKTRCRKIPLCDGCVLCGVCSYNAKINGF